MAKWNACAAHETLEIFLQQGAFDNAPSDRVGPIENNHRSAKLCARLQTFKHRPSEGVNARPYVLQVDDQTIEASKHFASRPPAFAVQTEHRNVERTIPAVRRLDHVRLLLAP